MLRAIQPKGIGSEWERVRAGLLIVKQATTDDWLPEDVYMLLKGGGATLFIGEDDAGEYLGFLVLRVVPTFHSSKLEVWAAYSATKTPLLARFWPAVQERAAAAGCTIISFASARDEWQAVGKRLGFTPKQVSYEFTL